MRFSNERLHKVFGLIRLSPMIQSSPWGESPRLRFITQPMIGCTSPWLYFEVTQENWKDRFATLYNWTENNPLALVETKGGSPVPPTSRQRSHIIAIWW